MKLFIHLIVAPCAVILFGSLSSCDGHPKNKPTFYIPQVIKDYCIFKDSSYWIYRDSLTGVLDNQSLKSSVIEIRDHSKLANKRESFLGVVYSSYYNDQMVLQTFIGHSENCTFEDFYIHCIYFHSDTVPGNKHHFTNAEYYLLAGRRDTMTVAGQLYKHIFEVSTNSVSYPHQQNRMFISRHVGVVKYTTLDGHIWELVRSNVKQ